MNDAVFICEFDGWRSRRFRFRKYRVHALLGIGIEHEKLTGMGAGVAEKLETVGFRPGESVLMAKNDVRGVVFELASADEAAASSRF